MQRDQMDYIKRRISEEDRAAARSEKPEAQQAHAEMAMLYRARMGILTKLRTPTRSTFSG